MSVEGAPKFIVSDNGAPLLCQALLNSGNNSSLQHLSLGDNKISDEGAKYI